jgi:archaellum component FlaD/FlaE
MSEQGTQPPAGGREQATQQSESGSDPQETSTDGGRIDDLEHSLSQLDDDVESNNSELKAVKSEFEELQERVDDIEENNAVLLGVYDRLTAGVNPFSEDWDTYWDRDGGDVDDMDHPYGVIQPDGQQSQSSPTEERNQPDETDDSQSDVSDDSEPEETTSMDESSTSADDRTVSFSDLKEKRQEKPRGKRRPKKQQGQQSQPHMAYNDGRQPYLPGLASNYATDILMMEWLTLLINIAGLAGALKALDYYENIDWISPPVKHQLEDLLSGAHGEVQVESRAPSDLTTEEHNRSFAYIMKLAQQYQTVAHAD